ncbi:MAG: hypothetical protein EOO13_16995, partial [Chitinophagaceae bacterium]
MRRLLLWMVFSFLFINTFSQTINISGVTTSGKFSLCGGTGPVVTATLIASTGTSVVGNSLICNDPCGTSTLRMVISNVQWQKGNDDNWIHGVFFPVNPGFSVSGIIMPTNWNSFASCTGANCSTGQTGGQGFYFDGTGDDCCNPVLNDGLPGNNYGDPLFDCGQTLSFQFDMTFCNSAITGSDLSFQLTGTSDGNTGCYSVPDPNRNNRINFSIATSSCPDIYTIPFTSTIITDCSATPINYYAVLTGGCGNGNTVTSRDAPFGGNQIGTGVPF